MLARNGAVTLDTTRSAGRAVRPGRDHRRHNHGGDDDDAQRQPRRRRAAATTTAATTTAATATRATPTKKPGEAHRPPEGRPASPGPPVRHVGAHRLADAERHDDGEHEWAGGNAVRPRFARRQRPSRHRVAGGARRREQYAVPKAPQEARCSCPRTQRGRAAQHARSALLEIVRALRPITRRTDGASGARAQDLPRRKTGCKRPAPGRPNSHTGWIVRKATTRTGTQLAPGDHDR